MQGRRTVHRRASFALLTAAILCLAASAYAAGSAGWSRGGTAIVCQRGDHVLRFDAEVAGDRTPVRISRVGSSTAGAAESYTCAVAVFSR